MFRILKTAALSALIGFGALAAMPATAQAGSGGIYLGFGSGQPGASFGFHFGDRGHHYRDRDRYRSGYHRYGGCSPHEAVRKASRMGLRYARVTGSSYRTVSVQGRMYGYRLAKVTFANTRNCPLIR